MNERERLEFLMKCYNLTPSLFADRVGIQRASVSHILSGRNKISLDIVVKINKAFPEASFDWLINGTGDAPKAVNVAKEEHEELPMLFDTPVAEPIEGLTTVAPDNEPESETPVSSTTSAVSSSSASSTSPTAIEPMVEIERLRPNVEI